jgi:hypothetical protein
MKREMADMPIVSIPLDIAELIDHFFLPKNPNRMRVAGPSVVNAVQQMKASIEIARADITTAKDAPPLPRRRTGDE